MKANLSVLVLLAALTFGACAKKNDVATLQHEAVAIAKYFAPRIDALDERVQTIFKRGATIPANLPGIEAVGERLTQARDMIVQLRGIVGPGADGKSAVEKQAEAAAKTRKTEDLAKLVHDTETTLERGITLINDNLAAVESWIAQYDRKTLAVSQASPQPAPAEPDPVSPPATSPSATGQPPAATTATPRQPAAGQQPPARPAPATGPRTPRPAPAPAPRTGTPARTAPAAGPRAAAPAPATPPRAAPAPRAGSAAPTPAPAPAPRP